MSSLIYRANAKVPIFILAGGLGTRISEETHLKPKPMVEIGGIPILVHIMRSYYAYGFNDFIICAGYRAEDIKKYFLDYQTLLHDLTFDSRKRVDEPHQIMGVTKSGERWRVRVIDTGKTTNTGGRIARAIDLVSEADSFENFGVTYGDGLTDANLDTELRFHINHGRIGTVLGVKNAARYGELDVNGDRVTGFLEKPEVRQGYISGGFFYFHSSFRKYLEISDACVLERKPLFDLASEDQLRVFRHSGFWHAMDSLRDKNQLQALWDSEKAPWTSPGQEPAEARAREVRSA